MDKVCEGCGRHWSDPIPASCPRCNQVFWVIEETTLVDQPEPESSSGTYYCGQCNIFHKADSGIGKRHSTD